MTAKTEWIVSIQKDVPAIEITKPFGKEDKKGYKCPFCGEVIKYGLDKWYENPEWSGTIVECFSDGKDMGGKIHEEVEVEDLEYDIQQGEDLSDADFFVIKKAGKYITEREVNGFTVIDDVPTEAYMLSIDDIGEEGEGIARVVVYPLKEGIEIPSFIDLGIWDNDNSWDLSVPVEVLKKNLKWEIETGDSFIINEGRKFINAWENGIEHSDEAKHLIAPQIVALVIKNQIKEIMEKSKPLPADISPADEEDPHAEYESKWFYHVFKDEEVEGGEAVVLTRQGYWEDNKHVDDMFDEELSDILEQKGMCELEENSYELTGEGKKFLQEDDRFETSDEFDAFLNNLGGGNNTPSSTSSDNSSCGESCGDSCSPCEEDNEPIEYKAADPERLIVAIKLEEIEPYRFPINSMGKVFPMHIKCPYCGEENVVNLGQKNLNDKLTSPFGIDKRCDKCRYVYLIKPHSPFNLLMGDEPISLEEREGELYQIQEE